MLAVAINSNAHSEQVLPAPAFPAIVTKDLNGKQMDLPRDFPGERTIVLVGFEREQQPQIDAWATKLNLDQEKTPWLEVPVIDKPGALTRWFIDTGMRRGIPGKDRRGHVVTLYTDKARFKSAVGIAAESTVHVFVVGRNGRILEHITGDPSDEGASRIQAAVLPAK